MTVVEVATRPVVTVDAADPCEKAESLMHQYDMRHLPVLDGGRPVGMVSERDLLFHLGWLGSEGQGETVHPHVASPATEVGEIVSTPLISIPPNTPVIEAARLMLENEVNALPLVRDDRLVGLATETDLLRCFAEGEAVGVRQDWRQRPVEEHMSAPLATVEPTKPTLMALRRMGERHVRHLPVLDETGQLAGIVSDRDVFRGCARGDSMGLGGGPQRGQVNLVEDVMSRRLVTVEPSATLAEAARRMAAGNLGALPVAEGGKLVGLLTETDLLRAFVAADE